MIKLTIFTTALGALAGLVFADSTCTASAPCYREGYCDSGPMFCMWSLCDDSKSYNSTSCWPAEGCSNQVIDFDSSADVIAIRNYTGNPNTNALVSIFEPNNAAIEDGKLVLSMTYNADEKKGFGATTDVTHSIQYGRVTARIKTAAVALGTVTAFIIRNDQIGDEIDFEWVGLDPTQVETNYFYHDILDYGNSEYYKIGADSSADYHDYTIDWSPDAVSWILDGKTLRTVNREDTYDSKTKEYQFPAAAGRVAFSIWDGGNSGAEGTEEWAGTPTPWTSSTVYKMYVESLQIECNADTNQIDTSSAGDDSTTESISVEIDTTSETDATSSADDADGSNSSDDADGSGSSDDADGSGSSDDTDGSSSSDNSGNASVTLTDGSGTTDTTDTSDSTDTADAAGSTDATDTTDITDTTYATYTSTSETSDIVDGGATTTTTTDTVTSTSVSNDKCHLVTIVRPI